MNVENNFSDNKPERIFRIAVFSSILFFAVISTFSLFGAIKWLDKPFPGFLTYENSVVCEVSLFNWPSKSSNSIKPYDKVMGTNNRALNQETVYSRISTRPVGSPVTYNISRNDKLFNVTINTTKFAITDFIQVFGVVFLVGIIIFTTGAVVYFLKPRLVSSKIFFLFCLCIGVWFTSIFDTQSTYLLSFIPFLGWMLSPAFLVSLALVFPSRKKFVFSNSYLILLPLIPSLVLIVLHILYFDNQQIWINIDRLTWIYVLISTVVFTASVIMSYIAPEFTFEKERAKILLLGSFFGFFLPSLLAFIFTLSGISNLNNLAAFVIIFPLAIAYAIVKHKLFDIDVIIEKALTYGLLTGAVGCIFAFTVFGFNVAFEKYGGWKNPAFFVILSGFLVIALNPLKNKIQDLVDLTFFRKKYDYRETVEEVSYAMNTLLSLQKIIDKIIEIVENTMFCEPVSVFIYNQDLGTYEQYVKERQVRNSQDATLSEDNILVQQLMIHRSEIFKEDLIVDEKYMRSSESLMNEFKKFNASLFIPLHFKKQLIGFIVLGEKKSGLSYTSRDVKLLRLLSNQSAIAIENALAFKLVEDYAKKLEITNKELKDTQEQLVHAEKMSAIGQLAAGIAHEIRNPLNIIEGARYYLSKHMIEKENSEVAEEYLDYIKHEIDRTNRLIDSLLKFSKSEQPYFQEVNVNSILENVAILVRKQLSDQNVNLNMELDPNIPRIMADPNQLWQVFINMLLNAIQAMPKGGHLTIHTESGHEDAGFYDADHVYIHFEDTGVGICKEDINKIFDPFFTKKDMGTGLGLSIAYKIIEKHKGRIIVSSEKDIGTTFTIELPKNNNIIILGDNDDG